MRVKKSEVQLPTLPEEVVSVPELGGDVLVRGLGLAERMALSQEFKATTGRITRSFGHLAPLLSASVLDADDEPLFTSAEWEAFGAKHYAAAMNLWDIAWRLSDLDGKEAEKNSKAPASE
jgi:hypothetical protein